MEPYGPTPLKNPVVAAALNIDWRLFLLADNVHWATLHTGQILRMYVKWLAIDVDACPINYLEQYGAILVASMEVDAC